MSLGKWYSHADRQVGISFLIHAINVLDLTGYNGLWIKLIDCCQVL